MKETEILFVKDLLKKQLSRHTDGIRIWSFAKTPSIIII